MTATGVASASLICSTIVGQYGSPAPKSMTSTPDRRSLSTAAPTAMVADVAIREVRSARRMISSVRLKADATFLLKTFFHQFRHQAVHLAPEREHFLDQPRAD